MKEQDTITKILKELESKFGTPVRLLRKSPVGGGCIHHATKLETTVGSFFLKWNQNSASDMFIREAECLQALKAANPEPLIIPDVILVKEVTKSPGYLLLEFLDSGHTSKSDEDLGRGLANLHRYQAEKFGFTHPTYCGLTLQDNRWESGWPQFFANRRIMALIGQISKKRGLPSDHLRVYERLVDKIPSLIPAGSVPALIHGDLWSGNYMLTIHGPALIDPASYHADREMEFGIMTMFGGFPKRFWDAYTEAYPLPYGWESRNKLYQLYHILNHFLLFGGGYGSSALQVAKSYL